LDFGIKLEVIFYRQYFHRDFIKNLEIKHTGALYQYCSGPTTTNTCLSLARHPWAQGLQIQQDSASFTQLKALLFI
jgi:hypothetical protein